MKISHNGTDYGLSFNTGYIDIFLYELGYELEDVKLPINYKTNPDGTPEIDKKTKGLIELPSDKHTAKKFSDFVYCFMKLDFESKEQNKGVSFPLSVRDVFGITIMWGNEIILEVMIEMLKSLSPNLTENQIKAIEGSADTVKKKSVGQKLKPVPIAKLD